MADRQQEVEEIRSDWAAGAYTESWGLCYLDNIKFQSKKTRLLKNNGFELKKHRETSEESSQDIEKTPEQKAIESSWRGFEKAEGANGDFNPDPWKIEIEGFIYPDLDSSGRVTRQLRSKIDEIRKICSNIDNPKGVGFFTHQLTIPLYKPFYIKIDKCDIETNTEKWGFASFRLECYATSKNIDMQGWIYADIPTRNEVFKEVEAFNGELKVEFIEEMSLLDKIAMGLDEIEAFKSEIENLIAEVTGFINGALAWVDNVADLVDITGIINEISSTISSLVSIPGKFANIWTNLLGNLEALGNLYTDNVQLWKALYNSDVRESLPQVVKIIREFTNKVSFNNLTTELLGEDGEDKFKTEEDVNNAKNLIEDLFENILKYDYSYDELKKIKSVRRMALDYLNSLSIGITEEFFFNDFTPSTVASYLRYGDLNHSKRIALLNDDNLFLKGVVKGA